MSIYRKLLKEKLNLNEISDEDLETVLDDVGKDFVYNYFVFKKDVTHEMLIEKLKIYLKLRQYI